MHCALSTVNNIMLTEVVRLNLIASSPLLPHFLSQQAGSAQKVACVSFFGPQALG